MNKDHGYWITLPMAIPKSKLADAILALAIRTTCIFPRICLKTGRPPQASISSHNAPVFTPDFSE